MQTLIFEKNVPFEISIESKLSYDLLDFTLQNKYRYYDTLLNFIWKSEESECNRLCWLAGGSKAIIQFYKKSPLYLPISLEQNMLLGMCFTIDVWNLLGFGWFLTIFCTLQLMLNYQLPPNLNVNIFSVGLQ